MNILLGASGFIGKNLSKKTKCLPIPHGDIYTTEIKNFDNLFYLASYGNLVDQTDIDKIVKANVLDVAYIINKAVQHDFKSFIFVSTSSVKLKYQTAYSRAKRASEEVLLAYLERFGKPIAIVRPYSVTGVGEQKGHLIPKLIRSCMTGEEMDFVGEPVHDFIDVDDLTDGILNLAKHSARGIFEMGTGRATSNEEVLRIVEKVTGKKANIHRVSSLRSYDNQNWVSTNFRSRSWGWLPKKSLEVSVTEMVKEYEKR